MQYGVSFVLYGSFSWTRNPGVPSTRHHLCILHGVVGFAGKARTLHTQVVLTQAGELGSRISGFGARWQEIKPHSVPSGDPALMLLKMEDYSKQLADLQEEARQMAADCAHFSMEDPDLSQLDAISDDLSATKV